MAHFWINLSWSQSALSCAHENDNSSCGKLKKSRTFSSQWWRRFCQSLVCRESATGQQLLYTPVFLFHPCVCALCSVSVCVCGFSLMSCSVWVSSLSFNTLASFWLRLLIASLPQRFPTSATSWAILLHPTSPGKQQLIHWWYTQPLPYDCHANELTSSKAFELTASHT